MIKVECHSCKSKYDLDERRIPPGGMRMRCPRCGTSFPVDASGKPEGGPVSPAPPRAAIAPPFAGGSTLPDLPAPVARAGLPSPANGTDALGLRDRAVADAGLPEGPKATAESGLAPAAQPKPQASQAATRRADYEAAGPAKAPSLPGLEPLAAVGGYEVEDLPAAKTGAGGADALSGAGAGGFGELDVEDLPAAKTGAGGADALVGQEPPSFGDLELPDLPAPKAEAAPDAAGSRPSESFADLDLGELELPADVVSLRPAAPEKGTAPGLGPAAYPKAPAPEPSPRVGVPVPPPPKVGAAIPPPPKAGPAVPPPPKVGAAVPPPKGGAPVPPPPKVGGSGVEAGPPRTGSSTAWDSPELPPSRLGAEGVDDPFAVSSSDTSRVDEVGAGDLSGDSADGALSSGHLPQLDERNIGVAEELDLEPEPADSAMHELEAPVRDTAGRAGVGGASFGEVDLGIGDGLDQLEFGVAGAESELDVEGPVSLPPDVLRRRRGAEFKAKQEALSKKGVRAAIGVGVLLALVAAVGTGLGLTEYGFFGMYFIEQYLPSAGSPVFAADAIRHAEKTASTDTYADVRSSLSILGRARKKAGLNRRLLARSLLHESLFLVRFGQHSESSARGAAILARLEERGRKAPGMDLALAADALRRNALGQVASHLGAARSLSPSDPYVELLAGELALRQNQGEGAKRAFAKALELGGGARAQWGLARALLKGGEEGQLAAVEETLRLSPGHAEARVARARILLARGGEREALQALREATGLVAVDGKYAWISKPTQAAGFSLLGYLHETRGRLPKARKAYQKALTADPYHVEALLGAGRVSLREHRHSDALARFESALKTSETNDPVVASGRQASAEAELGVGRALLLLGRTQEAKAKLQALVAKLPEDSEVILSLGDAYQHLGDHGQAEQKYRQAIELRPKAFSGYLALAQFFFALDRAEDASKILNQAAANVPESAEMRRLLGQSEMARNRLGQAVAEFERALELDPEDLAARFGLGVALRKSGKLDAARNAFGQVASRDPALAGLAMQRGLLYEAQGDYSQAEQSYRSALQEDPGNTDLLVRLGAAQVATNDMQAAAETLQKVIKEVPNSAEAEHLIGRIALAQGHTPDALMHFDRSVALDGTQAEFHLYAGKAALEMSNLGRTLQEAETALSLDPSLGEAYWLRGMVRLRMGAVRDALEDFEHSLKLAPSQHQAYAAMGDCYDQMRRLSPAVRSYMKALEKEPENGRWWYRLGRLELDAGNRDAAARALARAAQLGETQPEAPRWLADAHRLSGETQRRRGDRRAAIVHFKRYLELAPPSGIDRREVTETLERWGIDAD